MQVGILEINDKDDRIYSCPQFDFDPVNAASGEFDRLEYYQSIAHDQLFPIGSIPIGSIVNGIAYVGISKKFYWGSVDKLYLVGNSIESYLNNMFSWRKSSQLLN